MQFFVSTFYLFFDTCNCVTPHNLYEIILCEISITVVNSLILIMDYLKKKFSANLAPVTNKQQE